MATSDYKGKLLRLFREIMLLTKTPFGLSINELAEKLGVSYRTVYRDLDLLEQVGFFPEEVAKGKYVIRGLDSEAQKFEKNLTFNAEEAGILSKAVAGIPENHPLKKAIMEKLLSFSGMEDILKVLVKKDISRNIEKLAKATRERKQVTLHNYRSAHSQSIRSRKVEPYAFSTDGVFVKGFEVDSGINKTYKIERIEQVMINDVPWMHEREHEKEEEPDIFGINGGETHSIKLRMSMRAAQLLQEEFPLSSTYIHKEDYKNYLFEGKARSYIAVGRFILGLCDEIEILEPAGLKEYLHEKLGQKKF